MTAIAIQTDKVRPLPGSRTRAKEVSGATVTNGMTVKLNVDGTISKTASGTDKVYGICCGNSDKLDGSAEVGDMATVCVFGPLGGFSGGQPGTQAFLAATAGGMDTAGSVAVGYFETAEIFVVMPNVTNVGSS